MRAVRRAGCSCKPLGAVQYLLGRFPESVLEVFDLHSLIGAAGFHVFSGLRFGSRAFMAKVWVRNPVPPRMYAGEQEGEGGDAGSERAV